MNKKFNPGRLFISASASVLLSLSYQINQANAQDIEPPVEPIVTSVNESTEINPGVTDPSVSNVTPENSSNETNNQTSNHSESFNNPEITDGSSANGLSTQDSNPTNSSVTPENTIQSRSAATTPSEENKSVLSVEEYVALPEPTNTTITVRGIVTSEPYRKDSIGTSITLGTSVDAQKPYRVPVQLLKGELRDTFNIKDNPAIIGKVVEVTGKSSKYFSVNGIREAQSIIIIDSETTTPITPVTPEPIEPPVKTETEIPLESTTPISDVRNGQLNNTYTIKGTVISPVGGWGGNGFYVQDDSGSGIYVYPGNNTSTPAKFEEGMILTGKLSDYRGALQLTSIKDTKAIAAPNDIKLTETTINSLDPSLQSTLVKLSNVTIGDISSDNYGTSTFNVTDSDNNIISVRLDNRTGIKTADLIGKVNTGDIVNLTAILNTYNQSNQLLPYSLDHFEIVEKVAPPAVVEVKKIGEIQGLGHTSPYVNQRVEVRDAVVTFTEGNNRFYMQDIITDGDRRTSDGVEVYLQNHQLSIGDVVSLTGIVKERLGNGYNDRANTDLTITQIEADKESLQKTGRSELPNPIIIGKDVQIPERIIGPEGFDLYDPTLNALDFWESVEGMLVGVENPKIIGPQKYGDLYVVPGDSNRPFNNSGGINLTPEHYNTDKINLLLKKGAGDNSNFVAKAGDSFEGTLIGPVSYGYTSYKVLVDSDNLPTFIEGDLKPEVTQLEINKDHLSIASYNIENFTANVKDTSNEKVERIAKSLIKNLNSPDIIAVVEMQDNDGTVNSGDTSANLSAQRLIDAILAAGGPTYAYIDIAPLNNQDGGATGGNIRNGYLYNPQRVKLVDKPIGDATTAITWGENGLSHSIGRIDPNNPIWNNTRKPLVAEFEFIDTPNDKNNPEKVIVINTHLNSKRGDNGVFGKIQPVTFSSENKRHQLATLINQFVEDGKNQHSNLNVVLSGDFNDYEFTKTIEILEGNSMVNLVSLHDEADRYSYFYQGNSQSLDNVLISKQLLEWSAFDMVHLNAPFMEEHGRASDHDPLLLHLNLAKRLVTLKEEEVVIPFNIKRVLNDQLLEGVERITQDGENGTRLNTYSVLTINHELQSEELMYSQVLKAAVDQIIEVGSKPITQEEQPVKEDDEKTISDPVNDNQTDAEDNQLQEDTNNTDGEKETDTDANVKPSEQTTTEDVLAEDTKIEDEESNHPQTEATEDTHSDDIELSNKKLAPSTKPNLNNFNLAPSNKVKPSNPLNNEEEVDELNKPLLSQNNTDSVAQLKANMVASSNQSTNSHTSVDVNMNHSSRLPETGESKTYLIFNATALSILAGIGLIHSKRDEEVQ